MEILKGSITAPEGFLAEGVACGLKKNGQPDLTLVISDTDATVAGVFTTNKVKGHSLVRSMEKLNGTPKRGIIINSGNANACVGDEGLSDADTMAAAVAHAIGCHPDAILTGSTGVIGKRLDMNAVLSGVTQATRLLDTSEEAGHRAEKAIMTTDLIAKEGVVRIQAGGQTITLAGMAKGSGMIHPNMATMIGVMTTDARIAQPLLQQMLRDVTGRTFNRVSVDGDTSVCDMVVIMANGRSQAPEIQPGTPEATLFQEAMTTLATHLSRLIARDGEGATKLIDIVVNGAATPEDAYKIVLAVGRSPLVKTAMFGEDANWGRILTAAGYSGADFDPAGCDIYLGSLKVCAHGNALLFDESEAKKVLKKDEIQIRIELQDGGFSDRLWTCDFSYDYVKINGSYRT